MENSNFSSLNITDLDDLPSETPEDNDIEMDDINLKIERMSLRIILPSADLTMVDLKKARSITIFSHEAEEPTVTLDGKPLSLKNLRIDFQGVGSYISDGECQITDRLLKLLINKGIHRIESLHLTNMGRVTIAWRHCSRRKDVVLRIIGLLATQSNLRNLSITNAGADVELARNILHKVDKCGSNLESLDVHGIFQDTLNITPDEIAEHLMENLRNCKSIRTLVTSEEYMTENFMLFIGNLPEIQCVKCFRQRKTHSLEANQRIMRFQAMCPKLRLMVVDNE